MVIWPFEHIVRGWEATAEKSTVEGSTISRKRFVNVICSYHRYEFWLYTEANVDSRIEQPVYWGTIGRRIPGIL